MMAIAPSVTWNAVSGTPGTMVPSNTCCGWFGVSVIFRMRMVRGGGLNAFLMHTRYGSPSPGT